MIKKPKMFLNCSDLLFEIIIHCDYLTIKELCLAGRKISELCKTNIQISNRIQQKKTEYIKNKTDQFIKSKVACKYMAKMHTRNNMYGAFYFSVKTGDISVINELIIITHLNLPVKKDI